MKKILSLLPLLVLAVACSAPPTNREAAPDTNRPAEAKSTAAVSEADITAREKAVWEAIEKKNYDAFGNMLASDYFEVGDDGVYDKTGIVSYVKDLDISNTAYSDWKTLPIDKDAVVVMYNVTIHGTHKGKAIPPGPYRAASAWVNRDGKWLGIYYQETPMKTGAPPPPAPKASQPAKTAASPAAKPAEAGPDPIANEKIVWDAFKSRNYDAFAALLAPDFVEVEPDGVYDKAGSVKGVTQFDATGFELSDWKVIKFDNDAALVSYLMTPPKGDKERHSSIWANRGGKWLAVFHMGTPQQKPEAKPAAKADAKKP